MKLNIVGDGSFGSFLKELLRDIFELTEDANSVVLAVPISAYDELGAEYGIQGKHLINVCSVQEPSTHTLGKHTDKITSIHPLFGRRTPENKRTSIVTYMCRLPAEEEFLDGFGKISRLVNTINGTILNPTTHDQLMAKTHLTALLMAKQAKIFVDRAKNVPDEFIPHSFRLLREFVKTMDDMPHGTIESIMANPYF